jgi:hypothetical protein
VTRQAARWTIPGDLKTFGYSRPRIRAFVFDLEGSLVETEELKALSYARAAAELRPDLNEGEVIEA